MKQWVLDLVHYKRELLELIEKNGYLSQVEQVASEIVKAIRNGNKVIIAGNGGSAADAQHFASELVGRFTVERRGLPALSLCVDPSAITCIGNDYGYTEVFSRQIEALGRKGDVFVAISTSGNSENCIRAIETAHEHELTIVGFLGKCGGKIKSMCDYALVVPSDDTPRIQEMHTMTLHIVCEYIEKEMFGGNI